MAAVGGPFLEVARGRYRNDPCLEVVYETKQTMHARTPSHPHMDNLKHETRHETGTVPQRGNDKVQEAKLFLGPRHHVVHALHEGRHLMVDTS